MFKTLALLAALAVAVPTMALAQGNSDNTPAAQNANGVPFTGNDPPDNTFNSPPILPAVMNPGNACNVLRQDKDDQNGTKTNGDDTNGKTTSGNPNCQPPASP